jgi:hypothetical protein
MSAMGKFKKPYLIMIACLLANTVFSQARPMKPALLRETGKAKP